jgi:deazaflavin-dependent oxidoreductase (nitroreductase family)
VDPSAGRGGKTSRIPARKQRQAKAEREVTLAAEQYLYLTTCGRRSGLLREIEIWFTEWSGRYYVIAEYRTSHWVQNIRANSQVKVRVREKEFQATARFVSPENESEINHKIQELSRKKYGWGDGLVVELIPG